MKKDHSIYVGHFLFNFQYDFSLFYSFLNLFYSSITTSLTYLRLGMVDFVPYLLQRNLLRLDRARLCRRRGLRGQRVFQLCEGGHHGVELLPELARDFESVLKGVAAVVAGFLDLVP